MIEDPDTHHMRRILMIVITAVVVAVMIPVSVWAGARFGLAPRHWSGAQLISAPPYRHEPLIYASAEQLGGLPDLNRANPDDLAGYDYDGELVAYVATDRGEHLVRDQLKAYPSAWRIKRVKYSETQLREAQDQMEKDLLDPAHGLLRTKRVLVTQMGVAEKDNCVDFEAVRINQELFWALEKWGDTACVKFAPNATGGHNDAGGAGSPPDTLWKNSYAPGVYWVLLTGFPLYIAVVLGLALAIWLVVIWRHRRQATTTA